MDINSEPRILAAERVTNCVVITFDDGKCALFSAALLHRTLPEAEPIPDPDGSELYR